MKWHLIVILIFISLIISDGEGNGNPLQYSCLENPMDGGAWWAAIHGVEKSWTRLSNWSELTQIIYLLQVLIVIEQSSEQNILSLFY